MFVLRLRQVARPAWGFVAAISLISLFASAVVAAARQATFRGRRKVQGVYQEGSREAGNSSGRSGARCRNPGQA